MRDMLLQKISDTVFEMEYPPINPTITKEDIIELLKDIEDYLVGEEVEGLNAQLDLDDW
jgi:hypothetical protein